MSENAHPAKGVLATRRITQRSLAAQTDYTEEHLSSVLNKHYPACPGLRARVATALGLPESVLFDAEAAS